MRASTKTRLRSAGAAVPPLPRPLLMSTTTRLRAAGATVPYKNARGGEAAVGRTKAAATIKGPHEGGRDYQGQT
jgi:hypothetical protein